jgi:putative aldouronate transport system substrate-binding protein
MVKKVVIVFLAVSLAAVSALAQTNDPFGRYDKTLTINIGKQVDPDFKYPEGDNPENNIYSRYLLKTLNIDVKNAWQAGSQSDYFQKVNLSIAANDLPDGLGIITSQHLKAMVDAGQVADLTDVYKKYASPAMKAMFEKSEGAAMSAVTFGGKMYAIPNIAVPEDAYHFAWIRKDWLDKLGLQPPKNLTELEAVAKAFVEKDPGGNGPGNTVGIGGPQNGGKLYCTFVESTSNAFGFDPVFGAMHAYPGFWIKGPDGKAMYGSLTPETKAALAKLADLYKKGLIDKEMGVQKDATQPVVSGRAGIFFGPWWLGYWPFPDAWKQNPKADWQAYAILDDKGKFTPHGGMTSNQFSVVRKGYDHPEALIKILNCLIRDESTFDLKQATIGDYPLRVPMAFPDECKVTVNALRDVLAGKKKPADFDTPEYRAYKLLFNDVSNVRAAKLDPVDKMDIQFWKADDPNRSRYYSLMVGCSPLYAQPYTKTLSLVWTQTKTMESKWPTLKKLEDETFLKIIMGVAPVSSFDTFVKNWKAQGGDKITEEVRVDVANK